MSNKLFIISLISSRDIVIGFYIISHIIFKIIVNSLLKTTNF
jgi:hypothetical protein